MTRPVPQTPAVAPRTAGELAALRAAAIIESRVAEGVTLAELADAVGASPSHLQRTFTRLFGRSPRAFLAELRLERVREGLRAGETLTEATYSAGFGSSRALYEKAKEGMGMTPGAYRRGAAGLEIRYTTLPSPFGLMLVGRTGVGVCAVLLGDTDAGLAEALRREFPNAELVRDDAETRRLAEAVLAAVGDPPALAAIPLDLRGTEFQRRVWAALREIPSGATVTYSEIARRIGSPTSVRAVANACGDNHVAVVVPCHRVVRSDGGLGGYKWGVERKRRLLDAESSAREVDPGGE